jgi:hypothetical protein
MLIEQVEIYLGDKCQPRELLAYITVTRLLTIFNTNYRLVNSARASWISKGQGSKGYRDTENILYENILHSLRRYRDRYASFRYKYTHASGKMSEEKKRVCGNSRLRRVSSSLRNALDNNPCFRNSKILKKSISLGFK